MDSGSPTGQPDYHTTLERDRVMPYPHPKPVKRRKKKIDWSYAMVPKSTPYRSAAYLEFIRRQPCIINGKKAEAHHEGFGESIMADKVPDFQYLPLASDKHRERTDFKGKWHEFYKQYNVDPNREMRRLINKFLNEGGRL